MRSRISSRRSKEKSVLPRFRGSLQRSCASERYSRRASTTESRPACDIVSSSPDNFRYTIPTCPLAPHAINEFITGNNIGNRTGSDRVYPDQLDRTLGFRKPLDRNL